MAKPPQWVEMWPRWQMEGTSGKAACRTWWIVTGTPTGSYVRNFWLSAFGSSVCATFRTVQGLPLLESAWQTFGTLAGVYFQRPIGVGSAVPVIGQALPSTFAYLIKLRAPLVNPTYRNHFYLPSVKKDFTDGSQLSAAGLLNVVAMLSLYQSGFSLWGLTASPALYHQPDDTLHLVTDLRVDLELSYLHRRRVGRPSHHNTFPSYPIMP